jgi:alkylmercury lyase-like protein
MTEVDTAAAATSSCATSPSCAASPPALDQPDEVLDTACRALMRTNAAVPVDELARLLDRDVDSVTDALREHEQRGRIGWGTDGRVVASAGVSVVPSEYELRLGARVLWAWCAKTALGVVSALGMGGQIRWRSPYTGDELSVDFDGSRPRNTDLAVFWPSDTFRDSCGSAAEDYCPSFSMFENAAAGQAWAGTRGVPGEVVGVEEAIARASVRWRHSLDVTGAGRDLTSVLAHPAPQAAPAAEEEPAQA